LREEHKLQVIVFENRVPREVLAPRREEMTVDGRKLLTE
jgi:hypothetical protein